MVFPNELCKADGNWQPLKPRRPRKFLFDVDGLPVSVHRDGPGYFCAAIWDGKIRVGSVGLWPFYTDVTTIYGVDTHITEGYQGRGLALRAYVGLAEQANIALASCSQSPGARKLWCRLAESSALRFYFVAGDSDEPKLFESDIYDVELRNGALRGINGKRTFDPYKRVGSLLLVRQGVALDRAIRKHMALREQYAGLKRQFKRYDCHKLLSANASAGSPGPNRRNSKR